jgi:hypothetical protein
MNISSGWNEGDVFWAYQLIILSVFISVLSKSKWKHSLFLVVSLFFMVQASIVFYDTFSTIYADSILGITFAYLFYLAISKQTLVSNWNFANFLIALSAFILIKDISIGLVIIPIIAITFNQLIFSVSRISDSLEVAKITIFRSCTSLAVVFLTRLIWAAFVHDGEINATVALSNSPNRFNNIFTESSKSSEIKTSLIYEVIHGQIGESRIFDFAVLDWIAIFLVLSVLFVVSSRSKLDFWLRLSTSLTLLAGSFLYLFVLFLSYLTVFDGENASSLTSFDRYISTYLTGALLFFTFMAAQELNDFNVNRLRLNRNLSGAIIVSVPILSIFIAALLIRYDEQERLATYRDKPADYSTRVRIPFDDLAQRFNDAKFNKEDRIWVITQHKHGFEYYLLQYELLPASVPANPFSIGTPYNSEDIWTDTSMTKEKWDATLNDFDFVVVFNSTQTFIDEFGSLFEDPESLNAQGIYRVVHGTSGNLLVAYK